MSDEADIESGLAAWARIRERSKATFSDWIEVGRMLIAGRSLCMKRANCNSPYGPGYQRFIREWLEQHGLQEIDSHERRGAIVCVENFAEIEAWRSKLSAVEQRRCNHPNSILAHWRRNTRPVRSGPKTSVKTTHASKPIKPSQDMVRVFAAMLRKAWTNDTFLMSSTLLQDMREHREEFLEFLTAEPPKPPPRAPAAPVSLELSPA